MSEIRAVEIDITPIANGVIGKVIVRHGDYTASVTPIQHFETLDNALGELCRIARHPEDVIADHPASDEPGF